jgi:hypothetical protein
MRHDWALIIGTVTDRVNVPLGGRTRHQTRKTPEQTDRHSAISALKSCSGGIVTLTRLGAPAALP